MKILTYLRLSIKNAALDHGASEEGAVATEYVFLLVLVAIAIVVAVTSLGTSLSSAFTDASTKVDAGVTAGTPSV